MCMECVPSPVGGAGGKGTWGKLVEVYDDDGHTHDNKDPNYDSEEEVVRGRERQREVEGDCEGAVVTVEIGPV